MTRFYSSDSVVEVAAWEEADAFSCDDAEVWIQEDVILVSYFDEDGIVVLEGLAERSPEGQLVGYTLAARSRPRKATLNFPEPNPGDEEYFVKRVEAGSSADEPLVLVG